MFGILGEIVGATARITGLAVSGTANVVGELTGMEDVTDVAAEMAEDASEIVADICEE